MLSKDSPNILFVVIDAARPHNLGCYGHTKATSPHIDKLASSGVLFEHHYTAINTTDPSLTTVFSGKYPVSHGIMNHGSQTRAELATFQASGTTLLPEVLSRHGYRTMAVDWLGRWHTRGYQYYSGILQPGGSGTTRALRTRTDPQGRLLQWWLKARKAFPSLKKNPRPKPMSRSEVFADAAMIAEHAAGLVKQAGDQRFFLFLHFWDAHWPYACPPAYAQRLYDAEAGARLGDVRDPRVAGDLKAMGLSTADALARYDGAIAYVDHSLGLLFEALESLRLLDNTLVIVTADHGESLGEHGIFFDHHGLYDHTVHVPLVMRHPSLPSGTRVSDTTRHVDIVPTLLDMLGLESPSDVDGQSLVPRLHGRGSPESTFVYAEERHWQQKTMIATPKYKYIRAVPGSTAKCRLCQVVHGGTEELYDLLKDPEEAHNISPQNPEVAGDLKALLSQYVASLAAKREGNQVKAALDRLKDRGRV